MRAQSLVICSSPADLAVADKIRRSIEANCPSIRLGDGAIVSSANEVLEIVEGALSADIVLLLLSPDAIPNTWSREQWEPVFVAQPRELGTPLGFVLVHPYRFPEVLRKRNFFDLSSDVRPGLRKLRQWLLEQDPVKRESIEVLPPRNSEPDTFFETVAELERLVVDQPATQYDVPRETALAFAHANSRNFEGVFWLDCNNRSREGVIGDTAQALGLKLRGTTAENTVALQEFCAGLRCLFVFDGLRAEQREWIALKGHPSIIFTTCSVAQPHELPFAETVQLFAQWRTDSKECLSHLRDVERHLHVLEPNPSAEKVLAINSLGVSAFGLLRQEDRLAEAFEVARILSKLACEEGNAPDLMRWEWEKSWIRESWGQAPSATLRLGTMPEPTQLKLDL